MTMGVTVIIAAYVSVLGNSAAGPREHLRHRQGRC
jgi:hypothetical protein